MTYENVSVPSSQGKYNCRSVEGFMLSRCLVLHYCFVLTVRVCRGVRGVRDGVRDGVRGVYFS